MQRVVTLTDVILLPSSTSHKKKVLLPAERSKVTAVIRSIPHHIMEIKWGRCNDSAPHSPEVMRSKANNLSLGEMFQESCSNDAKTEIDVSRHHSMGVGCTADTKHLTVISL